MNKHILNTFKPVYVLNKIFGVLPYKLVTTKNAIVFDISFVYFIRITCYLLAYGICIYETKNILVQFFENIPSLLLLISDYIMGAISVINFININLTCKKISGLLKILTDITEILQKNQITIRHQKVQIFLIIYIVIKIFKLCILQTMNFINISFGFNEACFQTITATIYTISTFIDLCVESQILYFLYYKKEIHQAMYLYLNQKYLNRSDQLNATLNDINRVHNSSVDLARNVNTIYNTYIFFKYFNTLTTMVASTFLMRNMFQYVSEYTFIVTASILWMYISIYGTFIMGYMFEMTAFEVS